jgi:hypothetical protein
MTIAPPPNSNYLVDVAVWTSAAHLRALFANAEYQAKLGRYPSSAMASAESASMTVDI